MYGQQRVWWGCANAQAHMSIHWKNMPYVRPFCAGAMSSDCSGETERKLNANWALTDKIWHIHTRFLCMCERGSDKSACMLRLFWEFTEYGHMAICTPILYMFESSECAGETASMLRLVWEFTERKPICLSILCICESSEGSGGTAHMRMRVWAFTGRICHMYANIVHVREQWRNWQDCMHATSSLSIGWKNMSYIRPFMCMFESSEGSGETACMLRRVWAFTDGICQMYAHFVHVREQWRLWWDCMYGQVRLSIYWWNMPNVCPFCACAKAVKALTRLHACFF